MLTEHILVAGILMAAERSNSAGMEGVQQRGGLLLLGGAPPPGGAAANAAAAMPPPAALGESAVSYAGSRVGGANLLG